MCLVRSSGLFFRQNAHCDWEELPELSWLWRPKYLPKWPELQAWNFQKSGGLQFPNEHLWQCSKGRKLMTFWKTLKILPNNFSHNLLGSYMFWLWLFFNIFYLKQFENGRVVYANTLRAYTSNYGEITRQSNLKLKVSCWMEQDSMSHIMYLVHHRGNSTITGSGRFNTSMNFYTSSSFYYKVCLGTEELTVQKIPLVNTSSPYWHWFYTLRWLKFHMRWRSTRTCMSKWIWGIVEPWSSFLTPVWPHHHPMISIPELTTWSAMGKINECALLHWISNLPGKVYDMHVVLKAWPGYSR